MGDPVLHWDPDGQVPVLAACAIPFVAPTCVKIGLDTAAGVAAAVVAVAALASSVRSDTRRNRKPEVRVDGKKFIITSMTVLSNVISLIKKFAPVPRRTIEQELRREGFAKKGGGDHDKWKHPDGRVTTVPRHKDIKAGTAQGIRNVIKNRPKRGGT
jgi:mRNA interferase HicA